jgi:putative DNA methylase
LPEYRKKLIEVALPLEAINKASAREKSIRHGHPSTLHLWWARRPLAAARAVIFAQMVDDPSSWPDLFPTEQAQEKERKRLFKIIEDLVQWENTTNEEVLERARAEIWASWRRACAENADHPRAKELFDRNKLPAFHDPFAGGGSLPLEAQRLGLEAYASDLNPVAVLINKAMIEIPPKFAGRPPVNPEARKDRTLIERQWRGAQGLADDVRYYGKWMRDEAERRIGHLYPKIEITAEMAKERPDLKPLVGQKLTVIAWLWARTVPSPDPAMGGTDVPLIASYWICKKPGKCAWVEPIVDKTNRTWHSNVRVGRPGEHKNIDSGTKTGRGSFRCLLSGAAMPPSYLHDEGQQRRIGARLVAIVADSNTGRVYVNATREHEEVSRMARPAWQPTTELGKNTRHLTPIAYGYKDHASLFTPRQLTALDTLATLVADARTKALASARDAGFEDGVPLEQGGSGALAYADAIAVILGIAVSRRHDRWTAFSIWHTIGEKLESLIRLSAVPMTWEFAEGNPFSSSTGNFLDGVELTASAIEHLGSGRPGVAFQGDARAIEADRAAVVCTDPPYFDNIPYADLSDLFYVWLRRSLQRILPGLMSTVLVPKADELVADPARHGGREVAEHFFFDRMRQAIAQIRKRALPEIPVAIFYAFKQGESEAEGFVSTGWDRFLSAVIEEGFSIVGTWPVRTEQAGGLRNVGRNSLASSVVLVCRPRSTSASVATRRELVNALKAELPTALAHLQRSNIAPVDLAQAAIGPGMAVYTRYAKVLDAEGKPVPVREALALINQVLDEVLAEQEGDFDADSRWALAWFEQHGFEPGEFGVAETLSKAKNTSIDGLAESGILESRRGKVRLLKPSELPVDWDPEDDRRTNVWEMLHHLVRVLEHGGERAAAELVRKYGAQAEIVRELAYRLYTLCERKKRAAEALSYNGLVQSWLEITRLAGETDGRNAEQAVLFGRGEA